MTDSNEPAIDRSIYVMPMFVTMVVSDIAATQALYASAGFVTLATIPGPGGVPSLVHLRRQKYQDILLTPGVPEPGTVSASFAAGDVDIAEVAGRIRAAGGEVTGPVDTPWFTTDITVCDADGNQVTLTAPRLADFPAAQAWASSTITGDFEVETGAAPSPDDC